MLESVHIKGWICKQIVTRHLKKYCLLSMDSCYISQKTSSVLTWRHKVSTNTKNIGGLVFPFQILSRRLYVTSTNYTATLENIYSEENKSRVQERLLSIKPARVVSSRTLHPNASKAAVLIPLCYTDREPSLLFMVRSKDVPKHRGEVCFPGGMAESTDRDIIHTALRETHEEVGLDSNSVDVWGSAQDVPSRKDGTVQVTPVIGYCRNLDLDKLVLDRAEVEQVFTCTIASLCDKSAIRSTQFENGYTLPVFLGGQHRIWGLTAIFVHQLLTLIAPGLYTYKLRHRS